MPDMTSYLFLNDSEAYGIVTKATSLVFIIGSTYACCLSSKYSQIGTNKFQKNKLNKADMKIVPIRIILNRFDGTGPSV